ncbi:uncharacterized protein [Nicotiana tomentosiformis]|uniref:uncharacterized protein n=1 Tax=Nicotiana tomentosiformis TaxID=4098 RepID=UPI00388C435F
MAPYEDLYGKQCHSSLDWFELDEAKFLGTNLVHDALEKVKLIQERLQIDQRRQKSYMDKKVRDVAFMEGEKVLLKVSPIKGVMRFEKKVKLSPRFIGPFEVSESIVHLDESLAYEEESVAILDRQVHKLRSKKIAVVKVLWKGQPSEEATWETESAMQSRYRIFSVVQIHF